MYKEFLLMKRMTGYKIQLLLLVIACCLFVGSCTQIEIFENIRGKTKDHLIIDITSISIPALYNQREYALLCQNKFQKKMK